jgi:hypothetical protein
MERRKGETASSGECPPFGGSWTLWYATVLALLAALVALFAWITRRFAQ